MMDQVGKLTYHILISAGILLAFIAFSRVVRWLLNILGKRVMQRPSRRLMTVCLK